MFQFAVKLAKVGSDTFRKAKEFANALEDARSPQGNWRHEQQQSAPQQSMGNWSTDDLFNHLEASALTGKFSEALPDSIEFSAYAAVIERLLNLGSVEESA